MSCHEKSYMQQLIDHISKFCSLITFLVAYLNNVLRSMFLILLPYFKNQQDVGSRYLPSQLIAHNPYAFPLEYTG